MQEMQSHFLEEDGLQYVDRLELENNSIYRGQIKTVSIASLKRLEGIDDNESSGQNL